MSVAVVVPVLGRPQNAQKVATSIEETTGDLGTIVFLVSPGDDLEYAACRRTGWGTTEVSWEPRFGDFARKTNWGFKWCGEDYVFLGADDLEFTPGWDTAAIAALETSGAGVCGTQDNANPLVKRGLHSTHSLVRRSYIEECGGTWHDGPGVVYCEQYHHQYVDTELCAVAKERDCWVFAHDSMVRHRHPIFDRSVPMDSTYERALANSLDDRALFRARQTAAL